MRLIDGSVLLSSSCRILVPPSVSASPVSPQRQQRWDARVARPELPLCAGLGRPRGCSALCSPPAQLEVEGQVCGGVPMSVWGRDSPRVPSLPWGSWDWGAVRFVAPLWMQKSRLPSSSPLNHHLCPTRSARPSHCHPPWQPCFNHSNVFQLPAEKKEKKIC